MRSTCALSFHSVASDWSSILKSSLARLDPFYVSSLAKSKTWLPGKEKIFNAFSLPFSKTQYILFGESPYPRSASANGYAFWDNQVSNLWSMQGFSTAVNRATSLRNFLKMLLVTRGDLQAGATTKINIIKLNPTLYVQTAPELFNRLMEHGFLLLNASLVWQSAKTVQHEADLWLPFIEHLLYALQERSITLILFGKLAKKITVLPPAATFKKLLAEHPYNLSFINNKGVQAFFKPFDLLKK